MRLASPIFRLLRVLAWIIKGVLLLIAAGALVLWPMSRGRNFEVWASLYTLQSNHVHGLDFGAWCDNGEIAIGRDRKKFLSPTVFESAARAEAELNHGNWHWEATSGYSRGTRDHMTWHLGPISGWFVDENDADQIWSRRFYSAPCWLIAPIAGAWPLTSLTRLTLLLRRRIRSRRRARNGLCRICGYDLRASPERCPECGTPPQAKASDKSLAKSQSE